MTAEERAEAAEALDQARRLIETKVIPRLNTRKEFCEGCRITHPKHYGEMEAHKQMTAAVLKLKRLAEELAVAELNPRPVRARR